MKTTDGVVTDANGLIYMRARYYSPELRRFINADILAGDIANAVTLNRYACAKEEIKDSVKDSLMESFVENAKASSSAGEPTSTYRTELNHFRSK